jgi:hypothetical protein
MVNVDDANEDKTAGVDGSERYVTPVMRLRALGGWLADHVDKWLLDQRRGRILKAAIPIGLIAAAAIVVVAVISASEVSKSTLGFRRTLRMPFPQTALLGAKGRLYAGSESGGLVAFDPVRPRVRRAAELPHSIDYLAVHGDYVFAAGEERISRLTPNLREPHTRNAESPTGQTTLAGLAAGALGVWGLAEPGDTLIHYATDTLAPVQAIHLSAHADGMAISERGVWSLAATGNFVQLTRSRKSRWRTAIVPLPCHPRAITTEHDRAYVLCADQAKVVVLVDTQTRISRSFPVLSRALGLGLSGGKLWVLSPGNDEVGEYSLPEGARVGSPIAVGINAMQLAVDPYAVWIGESNSTTQRLDLEKLELSRSVARSATRSTVLLLPVWAWGVIAGLLVGVCATLIALPRRGSAGLPEYFPPRRIFVFMLDLELYSDVASGKVHQRRRQRRYFVRLLHKLLGSVGGEGEKETTKQDYSEGMNVRETILRLTQLRIPYRGLNYVFGVHHRGTRATDAAPPTADDILRQFEDVAIRGTLCLIAGSTWRVSAIQSSTDHVLFELPDLLDRVVGKTRRIPISDQARLQLRVRKSAMRNIAVERCTPGARVAFDLLAHPRLYERGRPPTLDLVVAWQAAHS